MTEFPLTHDEVRLIEQHRAAQALAATRDQVPTQAVVQAIAGMILMGATILRRLQPSVELWKTIETSLTTKPPTPSQPSQPPSTSDVAAPR